MTKSSQLLEHPPLAGLLLAIGLGACAAGCLLPQDEGMFPDLPPRRNAPLLIVDYSPPDLRALVVAGNGTGCNPTPFQVSVDEPDLDDPTTALWYVDRTQDSPSFPGGTILGGTKGPRLVYAPAAVSAQLASLIDSQRHLVEVFVTDGNFTSTPGSATRPGYPLPDGGTIPNPAYVATMAWFVTVQRCQ